MSLLDKIVGAFNVKDDYDDDYEDDDYLDEEEEEDEYEEEEEAPRKRFASRMSTAKSSVKNNITSIKSVKTKKDTSGREVLMFKPTVNEDINDIMDALMDDKTVVLNLEGASDSYAQKVIDMVSGCIYALEGRFLSVSSYIYIYAPKTVSLSKDGSQEAMSVDPFTLPAASGMVGRR